MIHRWNARNGYKEALHLGMPLVISMMSSTVMTFTDRIFLGNYSMDALGASVPAAIAAFLFNSFFLGVVEYIGVFVSQYTGANRPERVGKALWQGIWFCIPAGVLIGCLWFVAGPLFDLGGHPQAVRDLEVVYFRVLALGGGPFLLGICLSCFYSGRGLTRTVMIVNVIAAGLNVPLDYCLIYGIGPFPELGIVGAGIATVIGFTLPMLLYAPLIFTRKNEEIFGVLSGWKLDRELFRRFMRFGLPGGTEMFIDIFAVSFFVFMVGRIGEVELAATNIAFSIYHLAFMPTIGLHVVVSIMVGQAMGGKNPDGAAYATKSVLHLALAYMTLMALLFIVFPGPLLQLFLTHGDAGHDVAAVMALGRSLLKYTAVFTFIDAVAIVYIGGLKGAGDTRFIMLCMSIASAACMIGPISILMTLDIMNIHAFWLCLLGYVVFLAITCFRRFQNGPWRTIEVIEH